MRNHGEAEQAFRRALELNPNFALAHARLGHTLVMRSAKQEAIDSVEHALRLSPADRHVGTYASITMAHVHLAAEHYPECATWARRAIEKSPEWPAGHAFLTASLALEGDLNSAAAARDALLRVRPKYSLAWVTQNNPITGPMADRLIEGLRKAGVPEE